MRVQIPAYTDRWMMGDRYGTVVKTTRKRRLTVDGYVWDEIASVKLDKSGKTIKVVYEDCTEV